MHSRPETIAWDDARRRRLVRLCASISGSYEAAEDLAQETLLEAWRNEHKLTDPDGADRWLAAVARNVCLRWRRRKGPAQLELPDDLAGADVEVDDAVLDGLPGDVRDLLVRRYVEDAPLASIAAALSISEDAVSMRLTRAKAQLRRLLEPPADGAWQATRVWCIDCGRATMLRRRTEDAIQFRCGGCDDGAISHDLRLTNPFFASLVAGVERPTAILGRLAAWSREYFGAGIGAAACTRCGADVEIVRDHERHGLRAACARCGEAVSTSLRGIAVAQPEVRRFRRDHPRAHFAGHSVVERGGVVADVLRIQDRLGSAAIDVAVARGSLRVLD